MVGYKRVTDPVEVASKIREFAPALEMICLPRWLCLNHEPLFESLVAPWLFTHSEEFYSYPLRTIFVLDGVDAKSTSNRYVTDGVKKIVLVTQQVGSGQLEREEGMKDHWLAGVRGEDGFWEQEWLGKEQTMAHPERWVRDIIR